MPDIPSLAGLTFGFQCFKCLWKNESVTLEAPGFSIVFLLEGKGLGVAHIPRPQARAGWRGPLIGAGVWTARSSAPLFCCERPRRAEGAGWSRAAAVNSDSIRSSSLVESMLGKHSALLGGEVFVINRRYYHCKAVGGRHVTQQSSRQSGAPTVGCRARATCFRLIVPIERALPPFRAHHQGDQSKPIPSLGP